MNKLPVFASNLKCWRILNNLVFGQKLICPSCSNSLVENYQGQYLWCRFCRRKFRPTAHKGSWLYGMKLKPRQLFILLWCWQNRKSPDTARLLARVSYTTVSRWYSRFRANLPDSGEAVLAEVVVSDESYFGKLRSKQDQIIVAGAIALDNQLKLQAIANRSAAVLTSFVSEAVKEGALVITDQWWGYEEIELSGYSHEAWNHSLGRLAGTNPIERVWSSLKRYLRKLYGCVPTKYLDVILKEWEARHNFPELFKSPQNYLAMSLVPC